MASVASDEAFLLMECIKKCAVQERVFKTAEKEDVTVDIHIGYVGRSNNIIAVD